MYIIISYSLNNFSRVNGGSHFININDSATLEDQVFSPLFAIGQWWPVGRHPMSVWLGLAATHYRVSHRHRHVFHPARARICRHKLPGKWVQWGRLRQCRHHAQVLRQLVSRQVVQRRLLHVLVPQQTARP